jgi:hypothetical protein
VVGRKTMNPLETPLGSLPMNVAGKAMYRLPGRYIVWVIESLPEHFQLRG